jgi:hypothetical protein
MGWPVSTDPFAQIRLEFSEAERAIAYAEKQGWHYHLIDEAGGPPRPKYKVDPARLVWPFRDPDLFQHGSGSGRTCVFDRTPSRGVIETAQE